LAGSLQPPEGTLVWVDRDGRETAVLAPPLGYEAVRLSPEGRRVALDVRGQEDDIWIWAFDSRRLTRLTFDPSIDHSAVWTPDGTQIVYSSGSRSNLFWRAADGTGAAEQLAEVPTAMFSNSFSPDGSRLVGWQLSPKTGADLFLLSLTGKPGHSPSGDTRLLVATPFQELGAEISPDGAWLAYQWNASGRFEIYVQPFPDVERGRWQVSTSGGTQPLWARSGRELFYRGADGRLMAVPIQPGRSFTWGNAAVVVDRAYFAAGAGAPGPRARRSYDVSPDGTRFLMVKAATPSAATSRHLIVVLNFFEELKRLAIRDR
jgi:Tol biopolymer transport system component